jgi:hypothetical protein
MAGLRCRGIVGASDLARGLPPAEPDATGLDGGNDSPGISSPQVVVILLLPNLGHAPGPGGTRSQARLDHR